MEQNSGSFTTQTEINHLQQPFITQNSENHELSSKGVINHLSWKDVSYVLNKKNKQILDNTFGIARAGEITAIIGKSGAGKSSLLNILAGITSKSIGKVTGNISINGLKTRSKTIRTYSAYVR